MQKAERQGLLASDLFSLRYVHDARVSPDGRRIAYVVSSTAGADRERFAIHILDIGTGRSELVSYSGSITSPRWSPSGERLAFIAHGDSQSTIVIASGRTVEVVSSFRFDSSTRGPLAWTPDGQGLAFAYTHQEASRGHGLRISRRIFRADGLGFIAGIKSGLRLLNVQTGAARELSTGCGLSIQPEFSPSGKELLFLGSTAAGGYPPLDLRPYVLDLAGGHAVPVLDTRWRVSAAAWSPCGNRIVLAGDVDSTLAAPISRLWVVNRDGSNPECRSAATDCLGVHAHHDMPTWASSQANYFVVADREHAYATITRGCTAHLFRVALRGPVRVDPITSGAKTCVIYDVAQDGRVVYGVTDLDTPWDLYVVDSEARKERRLTRLNDGVLRNWPQLESVRMEFCSRDGLPLEGWYLRRADTSGPAPTILFIHGGPELVSGYAFRFDFYMLASNGYSIVTSNYRGSSGYGDAFRKALGSEWGESSYPDHMATVDEAIGRGLSDAAMLGVWGASFGGYSTCWIVGHTDRFRAAVAESAVTNLETLYYLSDLPDVFAREFGGAPHEIPEAYRIRSPLTYADRCRTPTLLIHGADDARCTPAEAEQFFRALCDAGCTTELALIPKMTHMGDSIGALSARRAQNEALLDWFERHLGRGG